MPDAPTISKPGERPDVRRDGGRRAALSACLLALAAGVATAAEPVAAELVRLQADYRLVGFSVVVVRHGHVVYNAAFGWQDVDRGIPMSTASKYRLASVSKTVTATAIMRLHGQGLLDVDADVSGYLGYALRNPNFPAVPITLAQLMTHTASLRDGDGYWRFRDDSYRNDHPPALAEVLFPGGSYFTPDMWSRYWPPGDPDGFDYCNLASGILAAVVERVTGMRFHEYFRSEVFAPLGMDACWQDLENLADFNRLAVLYRWSADRPVPQAENYGGVPPPPVQWAGIPLGHNGIIHAPQGGLRVSAADLARLMIAHLSGGTYEGYAVLSPEAAARMHAPCWSGWADGGFYRAKGLQVHITDDLLPGETLLGHAGESYGLLSDMYWDAGRRYGIIFVMNGGEYGPGERVFYDVEEAVFAALYRRLVDGVGDLDGDGALADSDASALAAALAATGPGLPAGVRADLNGDGRVTAADLVLLKHVAAP